MNTYICDIDGTIADNKHREWVLNDPMKLKKDWNKFFSLMGDDKPIMYMHKLLWDLIGANAKIVYFTGRPEAYRQLTIDWILEYHFPISMGVIMRPNGDYRPDDIIKWEMYQRYIAENKPPLMIFDDRNSVVKMWRQNGIPCLQCAEGDF